MADEDCPAGAPVNAAAALRKDSKRQRSSLLPVDQDVDQAVSSLLSSPKIEGNEDALRHLCALSTAQLLQKQPEECAETVRGLMALCKMGEDELLKEVASVLTDTGNEVPSAESRQQVARALMRTVERLEPGSSVTAAGIAGPIEATERLYRLQRMRAEVQRVEQLLADGLRSFPRALGPFASVRLETVPQVVEGTEGAAAQYRLDDTDLCEQPLRLVTGPWADAQPSFHPEGWEQLEGPLQGALVYPCNDLPQDKAKLIDLNGTWRTNPAASLARYGGFLWRKKGETELLLAETFLGDTAQRNPTIVFDGPFNWPSEFTNRMVEAGRCQILDQGHPLATRGVRAMIAILPFEDLLSDDGEKWEAPCGPGGGFAFLGHDPFDPAAVRSGAPRDGSEDYYFIRIPNPFERFPQRLGPFGVLSVNGFTPRISADRRSWCVPLTAAQTLRLPDAAQQAHVSPWSDLTLDLADRERAHIPVKARRFAWAAPILTDCPEQFAGWQKMIPTVNFCLFGGYLYCDEDWTVVGCNAIASGGRLHFREGRPVNAGYRSVLEKDNRLYPVTNATLKRKGAKCYCWILPSEKLQDAQGGSWDAGGSHGSWAYFFGDEGDDERDCMFDLVKDRDQGVFERHGAILLLGANAPGGVGTKKRVDEIVGDQSAPATASPFAMMAIKAQPADEGWSGQSYRCDKAFPWRKRLSVTLLALLGRCMNPDSRRDLDPLVPSVKLRKPLAELARDNPDRTIVLSGDVVDVISRQYLDAGVAEDAVWEDIRKDRPDKEGQPAQEDGPSGCQLFGFERFCIRVGDLAELAASATVHCTSMPAPFYGALQQWIDKNAPASVTLLCTMRAVGLASMNSDEEHQTMLAMTKNSLATAQGNEAKFLAALTEKRDGGVPFDKLGWPRWQWDQSRQNRMTQEARAAFLESDECKAVVASWSAWFQGIADSPTDHGFSGREHFDAVVSQSLTELSTGCCVSQRGHFFVEGLGGSHNQLRAQPPQPVVFLSVPGLDFCSLAATRKEASKYFAREDKEGVPPHKGWKGFLDGGEARLLERVKGLYRAVFSAAKHQGVRTPSMLPLGLGVFLMNLADSDKGRVRALYFRAQFELLCAEPWGFEVYYLNPGPPALIAQARDVLQDVISKGTKLRCDVVLHTKDAKFLAVELAKTSGNPALLNPSDCRAVMAGLIGCYWELGRGDCYVGEEDIACTSTHVTCMRGLNWPPQPFDAQSHAPHPPERASA
eukprot:TRINITY_DN2653_c0_g1_i1.p1 TRINITY_DN2653_c0_g1~~TRINITY_DN2653_c0_g1_i1.p1  ORF type:complete len:1234 (+),score=280.18 TRINITY_DN2653_c0_g1_i1:74-3775(+)